jgi:hypothetical protein
MSKMKRQRSADQSVLIDSIYTLELGRIVRRERTNLLLEKREVGNGTEAD